MPASRARSSASSAVTLHASSALTGAAPPRASRAGQPADLVAPCPHVLAGAGRFEREAGHRLRGGRPDVEVPVVIGDRDAVEAGDLAVAAPLLDLAHLGVCVCDRGIDLAGDEVLGVKLLHVLGEVAL